MDTQADRKSHWRIHMVDRVSRPPPLKNHKSIRFLSNIGPDPLKITKLPNQLSILRQYRPTSETPFMALRWRVDDGPLIVVFVWRTKWTKLDPLWQNFKDPRMNHIITSEIILKVVPGKNHISQLKYFTHSLFHFVLFLFTANRRQSKTLILLTNVDKKIALNRVFDCRLSSVVFDCCISGV